MYTQSVAICRFLAEEFGLSGKNDLENLELDSLIEDIAFLNESKYRLLLLIDNLLSILGYIDIYKKKKKNYLKCGTFFIKRLIL